MDSVVLDGQVLPAMERLPAIDVARARPCCSAASATRSCFRCRAGPLSSSLWCCWR